MQFYRREQVPWLLCDSSFIERHQQGRQKESKSAVWSATLITQHEGHNLTLKTHFDWLIVVLSHLSRTNKLLSWGGVSFFHFNWANAMIGTIFFYHIVQEIASYLLKISRDLPGSANTPWLHFPRHSSCKLSTGSFSSLWSICLNTEERFGMTGVSSSPVLIQLCQ